MTLRRERVNVSDQLSPIKTIQHEQRFKPISQLQFSKMFGLFYVHCLQLLSAMIQTQMKQNPISHRTPIILMNKTGQKIGFHL